MHQTFENALKALPQQYLAKAIHGKLAAAGIEATEKEVLRAAKRLTAGKARSVRLSDAAGVRHTVVMSPGELDAVIAELDDFIEHKLSDVTRKTSEDAA